MGDFAVFILALLAAVTMAELPVGRGTYTRSRDPQDDLSNSLAGTAHFGNPDIVAFQGSSSTGSGSGTFGGSSTGSGSGTFGGSSTGSGSGTFGGSSTGSGSGTFGGSSTGSGSGTFGGSSTGSGSGTFGGSSTGSGSGTFGGSSTGSGSGTFGGSSTGSGSGTFGGSSTGSGSGTFGGSNTGSGSGTFGGSNAGSGSNTFEVSNTGSRSGLFVTQTGSGSQTPNGSRFFQTGTGTLIGQVGGVVRPGVTVTLDDGGATVTTVVKQTFAPTVTQTLTVDHFVTLTDVAFQSVEVTLTTLLVQTVTARTRQVVHTPVNDRVAIQTTVVLRPSTITITHLKTDFSLVTAVSVDYFTITHDTYVIRQSTFTTTATQAVRVTSTLVRTLVHTTRHTSTRIHTITDTVLVSAALQHGYY